MTPTTPEAPVFDVRAGQVDVWPILALDPDALAVEIGRGDHDGYLSDVAALDRSHHPPVGRQSVQVAIRARMG